MRMTNMNKNDETLETIKNRNGNYNNGDDNNDDNYVVIVTSVCIKCYSSMFIPQGNRVNLSLQISLLCLQKGVQ